MRTPFVLALCAGTLVSAADDTANDYWIRLQANAWFAPLDGNFAYTDNNVPPTSMSVDEIGLGDSETNLMAEVSLQLPFFLDFHVGGWTFGTSGSNTLSRDIEFGDVTFNASDTITSKIDLSDFYGEIAWGLNFDLVGFSIGLAAHFLSVDGELRSTTQNADFDGSIPVPMVAVRAHVNPLASLGFEGVLHGLSLSVGEYDTTVLDLRLQAIYRPIDMLGVIGGLRHYVLDIEGKDGNEEVLIDLTLSGPFVGLVAQF